MKDYSIIDLLNYLYDCLVIFICDGDKEANKTYRAIIRDIDYWIDNIKSGRLEIKWKNK